MTKTSKAVFTIVALLVLVIITIVASIALYSWLTIHSSPYQIQFFDIRKIKVDAHKLEGDLLTLYIRNTGNTTAIIDAIYLISLDNRVYVPEPAIINSSTEIWGGDVWRVNPYDMSVELVSPGRIIDENFTTYNPSLWNDEYIDHNNYWSNVFYDPDGLKLLSRSSNGWAVRGLISRSRVVNLSDLPIVMEVDLEKTSYNVPDNDAAASPFAACMYLSPARKTNPYNATPWFAVKLYPRSNPYRTEAQIVARNTTGYTDFKTLYTWYSKPDSRPRGVFLLVFNETNKVYYYFWPNNRSTTPYYGYWASTGLNQVLGSGENYVYLTIDNRVSASIRKAHVWYLQVYKGYTVFIENIMPGWTIEITDLDWNPLYVKIANDSIAEVSLLDYILKSKMPLKGHIRIYTYNVTEVNRYGGYMLKPRELRMITMSIRDIPPGHYIVKIVMKDGSEYQYSMSIP